MSPDVACRLALVSLVMAAVAKPVTSSIMRCCFDAAAGSVAVSAEPVEAARFSAGEQRLLFSAKVSACVGESSAAARRIRPIMPAISSLPAPAASATTLGPAAVALQPAKVHSSVAAAVACIGADTAGQRMIRSASDSGLLLNPATLASIQQALQSAAANDARLSRAASAQFRSELRAVDAFAPDQHCSRSPCEASALLVFPGGPSSCSASLVGLAPNRGTQGTAQRCSLVVAGIALGLAPVGSGEQQSVSSAAYGVRSAAAGMLYEIAWLASHQSLAPARLRPADAADSSGSGPSRHMIAALESRGRCSIRTLRLRRHAAATATSTLEALQRLTGNAATAAVRSCTAACDASGA